jgi:hypothetical protein
MKRLLLISVLGLLSTSCIFDCGPCRRNLVYAPPPCPPAQVVVTRVVHTHGYGCGHRLVGGAWVTVR